MVFRDARFEGRGIVLEVEHRIAKHPLPILARPRFHPHDHAITDKLRHFSTTPFRPTGTSLAGRETIKRRTRCHSSDTGHAIAARTCRALNSRARISGSESVPGIPPPYLPLHRCAVLAGR